MQVNKEDLAKLLSEVLEVEVSAVLTTKNLSVDLKLENNLDKCRLLDAAIILKYRVQVLEDILKNQISIFTIEDLLEQVNKKLS